MGPHLAKLRDTVQRWRIRWRSVARRGSYSSTSALRQWRIHALQVETYLLDLPNQRGLGASIYIGKEELLRFDCLGTTGHFHINMRQSVWASAGRIPRIAFHAPDIPGQVGETAVCVRRNLRNAIDTNWRYEVRVTPVTDTDIDQVAEIVSSALGELIAVHQRQVRAHARDSK